MQPSPPIDSDRAIERVIREDWGRILSVLTRQLGDLGLAEDCLQDAVEAALVNWAADGLPKSPSAWLLTAARRKAIDKIRRDANLAAKLPELGLLADVFVGADEEIAHIPDKRLEMFFTCCHPALGEKTRVALTLRTLGGLTTEEIARAFLDKPAAMGQRLARARAKIAKAKIPYRIPDPADLPERLSAVMKVIYLIFNKGYSTTSGLRSNLSGEAIRLARIMADLLPHEEELRGLLAMMLLSEARSAARTGPDGRFIPLELQNRKRWSRGQIAEGRAILAGLPMTGPYQIQAAVSAEHALSPSWEQTDWPRIATLYAQLFVMEPNPVIRINQAVALSYCGELEAALVLLSDLGTGGGFDNYQPFFAARAEVHRLAGATEAARADLDRAIALGETEAEQEFLRARRDAL